MRRTAKISPADIKNAAADWIVRRDAGLTAAEQCDFECWKAADPRHVAAVAQHEQTWGALERPLRAGQADSVLQQLGARASRRRRRRLRAASTALAVFLVGGFIWQVRERPAAIPAISTVAPANAAVVWPEKRTLADGSIVELRAGSDVVDDFSGPLRRVTLRKGEAHFQVADNPERAFVVEVGGVEVRAVGTAFSVHLGAKEVEVWVTEGRVAVEKPRPPMPAGQLAVPVSTRLAIADAGNRVVVDTAAETAPSATTAAVSAAELQERLAWRAPRLEFSDTPLVDAIALMNQHSGSKQTARFVIADATLSDVRVSGFFRADNTETFVRLLEASFGVKAERSGDSIVLRKARQSP